MRCYETVVLLSLVPPAVLGWLPSVAKLPEKQIRAKLGSSKQADYLLINWRHQDYHAVAR
jgi:hypothetical protein